MMQNDTWVIATGSERHTAHAENKIMRPPGRTARPSFVPEPECIHRKTRRPEGSGLASAQGTGRHGASRLTMTGQLPHIWQAPTPNPGRSAAKSRDLPRQPPTRIIQTPQTPSPRGRNAAAPRCHTTTAPPSSPASPNTPAAAPHPVIPAAAQRRAGISHASHPTRTIQTPQTPSSRGRNAAAAISNRSHRRQHRHGSVR